MQVYGDEVTDLLADGPDAAAVVYKHTAARMVLDGELRQWVASAAGLELLLRRAEDSKRRAATAMNERSSRAHSLLFFVSTSAARRRSCDAADMMNIMRACAVTP